MSDNRWIIWQNACEATLRSIIEMLRKHFRSKAGIPHTETLELLEDFYFPLMPECTVDIAQDSVVITAGKNSKVTHKAVMDAVNNAVISAKISINEPPSIRQMKTSGISFKDQMEERDRRIQQAINEIGVPNKDYPVKIANAYDILMGNAICKGEPK